MAALNAWMNGEWVGTWKVERGVHSFAYARSWLAAEKTRPLSLSLPLTGTFEIKGEVVAHYFDNLLPDNVRIRERIGRRFKTKGLDAFALLEAIGRDCVGAVQLLPEGTLPQGWNRIECQPLSNSEVDQTLRALTSNDFATADQTNTPPTPPFRISLAGAQEKTAFTWFDGQWCRPLGATPSTHIFKLPLGVIANTSHVEMFDSVENEWVCAKIIEALGLPVARTDIGHFDRSQALIVERFDRSWADNGEWIVRLPQEDFCQALGLAPHLKYETDGGPSIADGLTLLGASDDAPGDRLIFQLAQLLFWIMAAPDGHAKNFSIFLRQGNAYEMTPLYDVLSIWPYIGKRRGQLDVHKARLAMGLHAKNTHYDLTGIQTRHWAQLAAKNGGASTWRAMETLVDNVAKALDSVESQLPAGFPARIWDPIAKGMRSQVKRFCAQSRDLQEK